MALYAPPALPLPALRGEGWGEGRPLVRSRLTHLVRLRPGLTTASVGSPRETRSASERERLGLPDRGAERMGRIDAENFQRVLLGKERQLFECEPERSIVRMALDIGIELGCR